MYLYNIYEYMYTYINTVRYQAEVLRITLAKMAEPGKPTRTGLNRIVPFLLYTN